MKAAQMRSVPTITLAANSNWKRLLRILAPRSSTVGVPAQNAGRLSRSLAQVRSEPFSELWFTAASPLNNRTHAAAPSQEDVSNQSFVRSSSGNGQYEQIGGGLSGSGHKPLDERTIKLGKTLRILSPLLPNILTTPLPQEILAPNISLHLFPSTHPHLPVVKGKIAYRAALWTAPVAWGCVPVVGNVKLEIMSEKMVRSGQISAPVHVDQEDEYGEEKLVVRWRTEAKNNGSGASSTAASSAVENGGVNRGLSTLLGGDRPVLGKDAESDTFTGLFVFSFDSEGRIISHTIEHADEAGGYDKTNRVITLTDWLLGKARWRNLQQDDGVAIPGLACRVRICREEDRKEFWRRRSNNRL